MKNLRQMLRRAGWLNSSKRNSRPRSDSKPRRLSSQALERRELLAGDIGIAHNGWNAFDVNDDRQITSLDALIGINRLGQAGEAETVEADGLFLDVNNDGKLTANDSLRVINALGRGEEVGELVELMLTARDLNDNPINPDASGDINVGVDEQFFLEVSYNDLRTFGGDIGAFQLFVDIEASTGGILKPVLNETQRLRFSESIRTATSGSFLFSLESSSLTYESTLGAFGADPQAEIENALDMFGYASNQFELTKLDFGSDDIGYEIRYTDTDNFGNVDLPDISVADNFDIPVPVTFTEFTPSNPESVKFNIDSRSRTFNNNSQFYSSLNDGTFDATGYNEVGGVGGVPTGGGGIPELSNDGKLTEPFDAFSLRVFFDQAATDLVVGVNPGEGEEATLLYGRNDPVPQDLVLIDGDATVTFNVGGIGQQSPQVSGPVIETFSETDAPTTVDLLTNATDPNNDTLSITTPSISGNQDGISVNNNIVTVTPSAYSALNTGQSAEIVFTYQVTDGTGTANADQTATITINGVDDVNDPPVVSGPVTETFTEDDASGFVSLLANSTDPNGDTLEASNIEVQVGDDDRGITIDPANNGLNVNPTAYGFLNTGESVVVDYTFTVSDGVNTPVSSSASITITGITDGGDNNLPTGVPTITGTVQEDETLTADTSGIADADGLGTFSFQWLRGGTVINGATSSTYLLGDADVGELISVQVSYTDGLGTFEGPLTSAQTGQVANVNDLPSGVPTITGTVQEDETLTAVTSGITDNDGLGTFSYQWLRSGTLISGATSSTYVLDDVDVGELISVQVSYTDGQGTPEALTSAQVGPVANINNPPTGVPTITGTVQEDETLTANTSGISDDDGLGPFSFQWLRNNTTISGATSSTYVLGDADVGQRISVQVTYTDDLGMPEGPVTSAQTGPVVNVNDAPVVSDDISRTFNESDASTSFSLLQFASDADGDTLNVSDPGVVSGDSRGVMVNGNSLDVNPSAYADLLDAGQSETIVIGFDVVDGNGGSVSQTVTVRINGQGPLPDTTLTGLVYIDELDGDDLRNGVRDPDEHGVGGVTVHLRSVGGSGSRTTLTDAHGDYSFDGVQPGTYEVEYDLPDNAVIVGSSVTTVVVDGDTSPPPDVLRVLGFTGTLGNIDIIASTYLSSSSSIVSSGEFEGAKFGIDGDSQEMFVLLDGFNGVEFAEFALNAEQDAALLSLVDGDGEVRTALVGEDDFVLSPDGRAAVLIGGMDDFDFGQSVDQFLGQFPGHGDSVEDYLDD